MKRHEIKDIYQHMEDFGGKTVTLGGWVRNLRDSKAFGFIDLNDGSCFKSVQAVIVATANRSCISFTVTTVFGLSIKY